jgi:hypothetical protein
MGPVDVSVAIGVLGNLPRVGGEVDRAFAGAGERIGAERLPGCPRHFFRRDGVGDPPGDAVAPGEDVRGQKARFADEFSRLVGGEVRGGREVGGAAVRGGAEEANFRDRWVREFRRGQRFVGAGRDQAELAGGALVDVGIRVPVLLCHPAAGDEVDVRAVSGCPDDIAAVVGERPAARLVDRPGRQQLEMAVGDFIAVGRAVAGGGVDVVGGQRCLRVDVEPLAVRGDTGEAGRDMMRIGRNR